MNKSNSTLSRTKRDFQPIKSNIKSFFNKKNKLVRVLYRTCMDKFGTEYPHNLIPKKIIPNRLVIYFDFYKNIAINNLNKIIAFTEKEGKELKRQYPLISRFGMVKIDLEKLPQKYIYKNVKDLKQNFLDI